MSKLTIRNLYRTYTNHQMALKDFKLETKDGELVAIVGPSECGKSVLLRIIAGLESSTDGAIWLDEQLINETDPKARKVAMVFRNYTLYPEMNLFDNLAFGLKLLKYPPSQIKTKVTEVAEKLGVSEYLSKMPSDLTPVECLKEALNELRRLQQITKVTTLFVTEYSKEAFYIGDRVAVMREGELLQIGTPQEIYDKPMNMTVAGAMMMPIMSFTEIEIVEKEDHLETKFFGSSHIVEEEIEAILRKKGYVNKKVILGIRPDDIEVIRIEAGQENNAPTAEVKYLKEYNGKQYAYFDYDGSAFGALVEGEGKIMPEDKIVICYKNPVPLLFNKDSGEAILYER